LKLTGYQVKYTERSGKALSKLFPSVLSSKTCHRSSCKVCLSHVGKGPSLCRVKSAVYQCVCLICDEIHKKTPQGPHNGLYVGETSRTLSGRCDEHFKGLRRFDKSCFLLKHWALKVRQKTQKFKNQILQSCMP